MSGMLCLASTTSRVSWRLLKSTTFKNAVYPAVQQYLSLYAATHAVIEWTVANGASLCVDFQPYLRLTLLVLLA